MPMPKRLSQAILGLTVAIVATVAVNIIAGKVYLRKDVTQDKIYSLSSGSRNIAQGLTEEVTAKLYYSKSAKDVPLVFKTYGTRVTEVLHEYASYSKGKLRIQVIDPKPDTDDEESARKYGINGANIGTGEEVYLGLVLVAADKESTIPFLDPRKEEFLEYDLSEALLKLKSGAKPRLGVMTAMPVNGGGAPSQMGGDSGEWVLLAGLKNSFDVSMVPVDADSIDATMNTLVVLHPKNFTEKALWAIDQFVLRGGRLIVAVDPFSRVDLGMASRNMQQGQMPQVYSSLEKLFMAWGVVYNPQEMIGDPMLATRINAGGEVISYPFFLSIGKENLNTNAKITGHLKQMLMGEAGYLDVKPDSGIKMEALIETSGDSGTQNAMVFQFMNPLEISRSFKTDGKKRTIAGLFTGKFKSGFDGTGPGGVSGLKEGKDDGMILVVADVDFLHDSNAVDKMQFGPQVIVRPRNDNLNFVINAAEFMGGSQDLISIRSSGKVARPFTRVLDIQKKAQTKWKEEEESLSQELSKLEKTLGELQAQRTDSNRGNLTVGQQQEIQKFRDQEVDIRRRRRLVRKNLREDIEALGHRVIAANLLVMPLLLGGFGVSVFRRRERRSREEKAS